MKIRNLTFVAILAGASVTTAFAAQSLHFVGGEIGFVEHPISSNLTRKEVQQELQLARQNKIDSTATVPLSGNRSYISPSHSYAITGEGLRHTDKISHNSVKPDYLQSAAEIKYSDEIYVN